jgi:hypothetical protein
MLRTWKLPLLSYATLTLLGGCAVVPGAAGSSAGSIASGGRIAIAADADGAAANPLVRAAIVRQLEARGMVLADDAPMRLVFGYAERDPGVGFSVSGGNAVAVGGAPAYRKPAVTLCREKVVRLSIAIIQADTAKPSYSGVAEDVICGDLSDGKAGLLVGTALKAL